MPYAYDNYTMYECDLQRVQNFSPMTAEAQKGFHNNNDHYTISTAGSNYSLLMEIIRDVTCVDTYTEPFSTEKAEIKILIQPVEKFHFRYISELKGTHGSLRGVNKTNSSYKKVFPTVQLVNCPVKKAVIRCTLVTADEKKRFSHAYSLSKKEGNGFTKDPHDIEVSDQNNYTATFSNMVITNTTNDKIEEEILRKEIIGALESKRRIDANAIITEEEKLKMKDEARNAQKSMILNTVVLCFQGFHYGENNILYPLTEKIYSHPINNSKSSLTCDLKICRMSKFSSFVEGDEEVWLLVERVCKDNIKVKFYEYDDKDNIIWEAEGKFLKEDVHRQFAIVFKTPRYRDVTITKPKEVWIRLERPSDGEVSEKKMFEYKPSNKVMNRKRPFSFSFENEFSPNVNKNQNVASEVLTGIRNFRQAEETFMNLSNLNETINAELISGESNAAVNTEFTSGEIRQLLEENVQSDFKELENWDPNEVESLLRIDSIKNAASSFTQDSASNSELSKKFAENNLQKIIKILKNSEMTTNSKQISINKVAKLLQESSNHGNTPLHCSLQHKQYQIANTILKILSINPLLNSILNLQNSNGETPLHLAVLNNQFDIVKVLLQRGSNPNIRDKEGRTSLHRAVTVNASACVDELLNSNIKLDLEVHTNFGLSALNLASKIGSLRIVKKLVVAGADVNSRNESHGSTSLHIAVDGNHTQIVEYLLKETKINTELKNFEGHTALNNAVINGAEEIVKIFQKYKTGLGDEENMSEDEVMHHERVMLLAAKFIARPVLEKQSPFGIKKEEKLTDDHVKRLNPILNRTGGWERLAQYINHSSLIRLYKKTSNPSATIFTKIRIQEPNITVKKIKKILEEIKEFEAAAELENK